MSSYMSPINYPCRKCSWPNHFRGGVPNYRTCNRCGAEVSEDDEKKALQRANHKRYDNQADRIEALERENARLREALEDIERRSRPIPQGNPKWINDYARAALQDKGKS